MCQISFDICKKVRLLYLASRFWFGFILFYFDLDLLFLALELKQRAKQAYMNFLQELKMHLNSLCTFCHSSPFC